MLNCKLLFFLLPLFMLLQECHAFVSVKFEIVIKNSYTYWVNGTPGNIHITDGGKETVCIVPDSHSVDYSGSIDGVLRLTCGKYGLVWDADHHDTGHLSTEDTDFGTTNCTREKKQAPGSPKEKMISITCY